MVLVVYVVCALLPAAAFWAAGRALDRVADGRPLRRPRSEVATGPSIDRLREQLVRLDREGRQLRAADVPARGRRLQTVALAYDDTLRACCAALGLPEPGTAPLPPVVRLQTEAALAQRGLTW